MFKVSGILFHLCLSLFRLSGRKMNRLAPVLVLLGFFWNVAFASFQVYSIPSPDGNYIQQTVSIDNEKEIANIHVHEGMCSSDTIFDYKHGYIATRIFSRRACFILKMEKGYLPEIKEIGRLAYERQMMRNMMSGKNVVVKYQSGDSFLGEIKEWFVFGSAIEHLCKKVPVYKVERVGGFGYEPPHAAGCAKAGLLGILGIKICGNIQL